MSQLEISKKFDYPKELLYEAWTNPEHLKQWWKPMGKQLIKVENDTRPGGAISYVFEDEILVIDGKYERVSPNDLLEYTWNWHFKQESIHDAAHHLSVRFEGANEHAMITITQEGFEDAESIHPHRKGWGQALEQLRAHVSEQQQNLTKEEAEKQRPPITGYMETPEQQKVGGG